MRRPGRVLAAAAVACLAAGGCDYLDNLTDGKSVARSGLTVTVVDAWTRQPLAGALCGEPGGDPVQSDAGGRAAWSGLATGPRRIECSHGSYHPRTRPVEVTASGPAALTVALPRRSDDWYPDDPDRQVSFFQTEGNLRFPGNLKLDARPFDSSGIFRYEWTTDLPKEALEKRGNTLKARIGTHPDEVLKLEFGLKVAVTLADTTYEVGSLTQAVWMTRNLPPELVITAYRDTAPLKVGCSPGGDYILVGVNAMDPDGECERIVITGTEASLSIGELRMEIPCSQLGPVTIPIKAHQGLPDVRVDHHNTLLLTAVDDNGSTDTDTLLLKTYSNLHPNVKLEQEGRAGKNFAGTDLEFTATAQDLDGRIKSLVVDWNDGRIDSLSTPNSRDPNPTFVQSFIHKWQTPGTYHIRVQVKDICEAVDSVVLPISVVANKPPVMSLAGLEYSPSTRQYSISVTVQDEDVDSGLDSLTVAVDWGDGGPGTLIQGGAYQNFDRKTVGHAYDPASTAEHFRIKVTATDSYRNSVTDTLRVTRSAAAGGP